MIELVVKYASGNSFTRPLYGIIRLTESHDHLISKDMAIKWRHSYSDAVGNQGHKQAVYHFSTKGQERNKFIMVSKMF